MKPSKHQRVNREKLSEHLRKDYERAVIKSFKQRDRIPGHAPMLSSIKMKDNRHKLTNQFNQIVKIFDPLDTGYVWREQFLATMAIYELQNPKTPYSLLDQNIQAYLKQKIITFLRMFKIFKEGRDKFLHLNFPDASVMEEVDQELGCKTSFSKFLYTVPFFLKQQKSKNSP